METWHLFALGALITLAVLKQKFKRRGLYAASGSCAFVETVILAAFVVMPPFTRILMPLFIILAVNEWLAFRWHLHQHRKSVSR